MANIKQQMKRNLTNEKRRLQNASFKSSLKTALKAVDAAVANKDVEGIRVSSLGHVYLYDAYFVAE